MSLQQHHSFYPRDKRDAAEFRESGSTLQAKFQRALAVPDKQNDENADIVLPISLEIHPRPWPGRKVSVAEDVVRYLSSVPSYLQHKDNGYDTQEKVLNVGVCDLRRLQKWVDHEKLAVNEICNDSSNSNASTMFSTFQLPSHPAGIFCSPSVPTKQCSTLEAHLVPCTTSSLTSTSSPLTSIRVDYSSNARVIYPKSANIRTLPSFIEGSGKFASVGSTAESDNARLDEAESLQNRTSREGCTAELISDADTPNLEGLVATGMSNHLEETISGRGLGFDDEGSQRKFTVIRNSKNFRVPQSSDAPFVHGIGPPEALFHTSGSRVNTKTFGDNCKESSESFNSPNDWQSKAMEKISLGRGKDSSTRPLENVDAGDVRNLSGSPSAATAIANNPDETISSSRGKRSPLHQIFDPPWKSPSVSYVSDDHDLPRTRSSSRDRLKPLPQFFDPLSKSSSPVPSISDNPDAVENRTSRSGRRSPLPPRMLDPPRKSSSSVCSIPDNPDVAEARSKSRGRRTPLRLMFDPPRKSSSSICSISDNPDLAGSRSQSRGKCSPPQMFDSPLKSNSFSSAQPVQESCASFDLVTLQNPMPTTQSTRQALLKLSWENGLPVLMFSYSDENILMATMHKKGNSDMNICNCTYLIHTAVPVKVKRKNGVWLSHKKLQFASKFVAEMIVSSSERVNFDLSRRSVIREFVLLGCELTLSNRLEANSDLPSAELAAIVIECSSCKSDGSSFSVLCECNLCRYSAIARKSEENWQSDQKPELFGIPRIVAILPSGVHGCSDTEEPSKLFERWESGGSCDCGGWDEGCTLTILTNSSQKPRNSLEVGDCRAAEGICGFQLFSEVSIYKHFSNVGLRKMQSKAFDNSTNILSSGRC
ncbi:hypothetical protein AXF42_Ash014928 [Apostasia shenzhenica]|uniref:Uncharacterized protein n=1 Tax=Apostasia shenzhenica TaxID=1088818 RepID=A0A2I0ALP6_9ASPA|nr:hypothetical protein AXF42_Ash014928 [Apostasia shenzhenica]